MKTNSVRKIVAGLMLALSVNMPVWASKKNGDDNLNRSVVKILIVGLPDNVNSNYYPKSFITEETGIAADSIDYTYNHVIADNIIDENKNKDCEFVSSETLQGIGNLVNEIRLNGEDEEKYADLSQIDNEAYTRLLDVTHTDYVLFLNQHYLKWQEKPLRTLFHIVSYSLYDKNKCEVTRGNNFFTSMNLEPEDRLSKSSRKSSSKIASNIAKTILR